MSGDLKLPLEGDAAVAKCASGSVSPAPHHGLPRTGCQRMSASAFSLSAAIPTDGFRVTKASPSSVGSRSSPHISAVLHELDVYRIHASTNSESAGDHAE